MISLALALMLFSQASHADSRSPWQGTFRDRSCSSYLQGIENEAAFIRVPGFPRLVKEPKHPRIPNYQGIYAVLNRYTFSQAAAQALEVSIDIPKGTELAGLILEGMTYDLVNPLSPQSSQATGGVLKSLIRMNGDDSGFSETQILISPAENSENTDSRLLHLIVFPPGRESRAHLKDPADRIFSGMLDSPEDGDTKMKIGRESTLADDFDLQVVEKLVSRPTFH